MGFWQKMGTLQDKTLPPCAMIIPAAGSSRRMGGEDKLFSLLAGAPVLLRTLTAADRAALVSEILVAAREESMEEVASLCGRAGIRKPLRVIRGGATRTESVLAAVLECRPKIKYVAVHDGARPLVRPEEIDALIRLGYKTNAVAPAVAVTDTIKVADENGLVCATPDRKTLFAVQTPQVFQIDLLKAALQAALKCGQTPTDDCGAVEALGKAVYLAPGDRGNIKITVPEDLAVAEAILRRREAEQ